MTGPANATPRLAQTHHSRLYPTNVRQIAEALGIDVSPDEYVELVDDRRSVSDRALHGRVTVVVTRIEEVLVTRRIEER